jgi:hypothetical protein
MAGSRYTRIMKHVAVFRLRLGVILLVIWWVPVYLAIPAIVAGLGLSSSANKKVAIAVISVQGIIGIIGLFLVGKQVAGPMRHVQARKLPKAAWHMFWTGQPPSVQ